MSAVAVARLYTTGQVQAGAAAIGVTGQKGEYVGTVTFSASRRGEYSGVFVDVNINGLAPNTKYGLHVHEFADVRNASWMGGHWNPTHMEHGCPLANETFDSVDNNGDSSWDGYNHHHHHHHHHYFHQAAAVGDAHSQIHFGDLGNVEADATGTAAAWLAYSSEISLLNASSDGFVLGRGVVLHGQVDDCATQPTGNSGARVAAGVVAFGNYALDDDTARGSSGSSSSSSSASAAAGVAATAGLDAIAVFPTLGFVAAANNHNYNITNTTNTNTTATAPLALRVALAGLEPATAYRLALYPLGAVVLSRATSDMCASSVAFTTGDDGASNCALATGIVDEEFAIMNLLGKALVVLWGGDDCAGSHIVAAAPIGAKPSDPAMFGDGIAACAAAETADQPYTLSRRMLDADDSQMACVWVVLVVLVLLGLLVGLSVRKLRDGYRLLVVNKNALIEAEEEKTRLAASDEEDARL